MPGTKYVVEGSFRAEVAPLPKSQDQAVGLPVDKSEKLTTSGEQPAAASAVKLGVGAWAVAKNGSQRRIVSKTRKLRVNFLPFYAVVNGMVPDPIGHWRRAQSAVVCDGYGVG